MNRDFLDIADLTTDDLEHIVAIASMFKRERYGERAGFVDDDGPLDGVVLAMLFEHPSLRTRVSFDLAIRQLGGSAMVLNAGDTHLGRGESLADTARVLARYVDAVMVRTPDHDRMLALAEASEVPVINGLTNRTHPCQVLGDILTIRERLGESRGKRLAWCGDGNNVLHSFLQAAAPFGFALHVACPRDRQPDPDMVAAARANRAEVHFFETAAEAVAGVDCVMTDTWRSLGDDDEAEGLERFAPFRVDQALMERAAPEAIFLHCLPAYRGQEVTAEVIDGPQSAVFDQAENRLHIQKSILLWCLEE